MKFTKRERSLATAIHKVTRADGERPGSLVELHEALLRRYPGRFRLAELQRLMGKFNWEEYGVDLQIVVGGHLQRAGVAKQAISAACKVLERRVKEGEDPVPGDGSSFKEQVMRQSMLDMVRQRPAPAGFPGTPEEYYEQAASFAGDVIVTAWGLDSQAGDVIGRAIEIVVEERIRRGECVEWLGHVFGAES